jgi:hypothetical protein
MTSEEVTAACRYPPLQPQGCHAPRAHRRCPPDITYSTSYEGNTDRGPSIAAMPGFYCTHEVSTMSAACC